MYCIEYPLKLISRENTIEGEARAALVTQMPSIVAMAKVPPLFLNYVITFAIDHIASLPSVDELKFEF